MTRITISDGTNTVVMPRTKQVSDAGVPVYRESEMASGRRVRDIKGFRAGFQYTWDYVPAETIARLAQFARSGRFFVVEYFDLDGTDKTGTFSLGYPTFEVFCYRDGKAVWHNCTLTILAQGVV